MSPKQFHDQIAVLFDKSFTDDLSIPDRMQMIGIAQYCVFTMNLALAEAIREDNIAKGREDMSVEERIKSEEAKEKPPAKPKSSEGDHFGA